MQIHANDTPVYFRVSYLEDLYYFSFIVFYDMPVSNKNMIAYYSCLCNKEELF